MYPSIKHDRKTPGMVPLPPQMLTPPNSTIVITIISFPLAISGLAEPIREVSKIPDSAAIKPVIVVKIIFIRSA